MRPVYFCLHRGSPHDSRIFLEILKELKRKRILRKEDRIIADKGYCSYENYEVAFSVYKVVPLIFPKKNMKISRILSVSQPLDIYSGKYPMKEEIQFFINLKKKFEKWLSKWKDFRPLRSRIEDVFKLLKDGFLKEKIHRYIRKSCYRFVLLGVLLSGIILNKGFYSKRLLQALAKE